MFHWRRCPLRFDALQMLVVVFFMALYSVFVFYMVGPQTSDCLSVRDFAVQLSRYKIPVDGSSDLLHLLAAGDVRLPSSAPSSRPKTSKNKVDATGDDVDEFGDAKTGNDTVHSLKKQLVKYISTVYSQLYFSAVFKLILLV
jgi:hypothetical protein